MRRVLTIGPGGSGKSTLGRELAARLGLPLIHMDQLGWQPGWTETGKPELHRRVDEAVAGERWLIEGNDGGILAPRLARADSVLYLDFPIPLCLARLLRRIWTYRGRARPDMPQGCPERFNLEFFLYVLRWNSGPRRRTEAALAPWLDKVVRLKTPAELAQWRKLNNLS